MTVMVLACVSLVAMSVAHAGVPAPDAARRDNTPPRQTEPRPSPPTAPPPTRPPKDAAPTPDSGPKSAAREAPAGNDAREPGTNGNTELAWNPLTFSLFVWDVPTPRGGTPFDSLIARPTVSLDSGRPLLGPPPPPGTALDPEARPEGGVALPGRAGARVDSLDLRHAGSVALAGDDDNPWLRLEGTYTNFNTLADPALGRVIVRDAPAGQRGPAGGVDVLEARVQADVLRSGGASLYALGGVRATAMDYLPSYAPTRTSINLSPEGVFGGGVRYRVGKRLAFDASAASNLNAPNAGFTDLAIGTSLRVARAAELSVGYQLLRGTFEQQGVRGDVRRDSLLVQFKLTF